VVDWHFKRLKETKNIVVSVIQWFYLATRVGVEDISVTAADREYREMALQTSKRN
jgi:hypothetical protein